VKSARAELVVENYFNYFTEIEEKFQRRRGSTLLLSTLDWALIASWKEAGIPLEAVLSGIDAAFERYDRRPVRSRKINSLAYCAQQVLAAAEDMKEAALGARPASAGSGGEGPFTSNEIVAFFERNAAQLASAALSEALGSASQGLAKQTSDTLRELAAEVQASHAPPRLEDLERRLTVLEEKLYGGLLSATGDEEILALRSQADHELAPYRRTMTGPQIEQLQKQYLRKRLLEKHGLSRLSLFYM
jgi:hypothetical protein